MENTKTTLAIFELLGHFGAGLIILVIPFIPVLAYLEISPTLPTLTDAFNTLPSPAISLAAFAFLAYAVGLVTSTKFMREICYPGAPTYFELGKNEIKTEASNTWPKPEEVKVAAKNFTGLSKELDQRTMGPARASSPRLFSRQEELLQMILLNGRYGPYLWRFAAFARLLAVTSVAAMLAVYFNFVCSMLVIANGDANARFAFLHVLQLLVFAIIARATFVEARQQFQNFVIYGRFAIFSEQFVLPSGLPVKTHLRGRSSTKRRVF